MLHSRGWLIVLAIVIRPFVSRGDPVNMRIQRERPMFEKAAMRRITVGLGSMASRTGA